MAGSIIMPLLTAFNGKGVEDAKKSLESLQGKIKDITKSAAKGLGSALVGAKAFDFVQNSVSAAADLQQAQSGVKTIFGNMTSQVQDFIKASESMGMTNAESAKAVTFLGSVFKQTGMPMQDVIGHTETMVKLGADLAATYGYSVQEALTAMTATFRGEYDPIEKFGVAMKQQQVNAELAARGLKGLQGSALIAAQQQIRYEMILQRTTDAQGAFGRQSGNLAVQMTVLKAVWTDMQASLGEKLLPALSALTVKMQPMIAQLAPHFAQMFDLIAQAITDLAPYVPLIVQSFVKLFDVLHGLSVAAFPYVKFMVEYLITHTQGVVTFVAAFYAIKKLQPVLTGLTKAVKLLKYEYDFAMLVAAEARGVKTVEELSVGIKTATAAQAAFNVTAKANPWILAATVIAAAVALATDSINKANAASESLNNKKKQAPVNVQNDAFYAGLKAREEYLKTHPITGDLEADQMRTQVAQARALAAQSEYFQTYWNGLKQISRFNTAWEGRYPNGAMYEALYGKKATFQTNGTTAPTAAVETWFSKLGESVANASAKLKLEKLNLPTKMIDSILSASDWKTASAKILKMTRGELSKLVGEWSKTTEGQEASVAALTARIDYAKQVYKQVADAIMSYGNVTSASSEQMTQSYSKMINGVEVTVSKTINTMTSSGVVSHYQDIVAKTKQFYQDLLALKNAGLNQGLFGQIVSAGVEQGGATASAILAGGQANIDSLNGMFADLNTTSQQLGDLSASVMQDTGSQISSAFIDGLSSNETALKAKAKYLATVFTNAFKGGLGVDVSGITDSASTTGNKGGTTNTHNGSTYVLNINAGMGTDGADLGKQIVGYIKRYERNNGAVWISARR